MHYRFVIIHIINLSSLSQFLISWNIGVNPWWEFIHVGTHSHLTPRDPAKLRPPKWVRNILCREHTLHRLRVPVEEPLGKLRITFLSRSTDSRRILNEDELADALKQIDEVDVMKVDFNFKMDFLAQISVSGRILFEPTDVRGDSDSCFLCSDVFGGWQRANRMRAVFRSAQTPMFLLECMGQAWHTCSFCQNGLPYLKFTIAETLLVTTTLVG